MKPGVIAENMKSKMSSPRLLFSPEITGNTKQASRGHVLSYHVLTLLCVGATVGTS
jgi:hypothetical protein